MATTLFHAHVCKSVPFNNKLSVKYIQQLKLIIFRVIYTDSVIIRATEHIFFSICHPFPVDRCHCQGVTLQDSYQPWIKTVLYLPYSAGLILWGSYYTWERDIWGARISIWNRWPDLRLFLYIEMLGYDAYIKSRIWNRKVPWRVHEQ